MKLIKFSKIFGCLLISVMLTASCGTNITGKKQDFDRIIKNLINRGQYKEAADLMNKAVINDHKDIEDQVNIAWIYAFNNHFKEALDVSDKLVKIDPKHQELYYLRGFIFQKQGNHAQAVINFKKAISLNPRDIKAISALAEICQIKQDYNDSIYYYKQAAKLEPQNYIYYLDLANIYFKQNKFKTALDQAQKAYNYAPAAEKDNVEEILENIKLSAVIGQNK